ncbi:glycerophosphodiester phosphodiesterase family protein [Sphingobacterium kitahiroshimense]|uniref:glycerophosphodiester phosphodiesterase family protein n=1 Tax=Sphingobacterium sp. B16(2022) TaxID=2914044 RepID=UPI0014391C43|nr:glycerophosphodiester phosphodiesterase family protein [Sphingobacterium sp. B16(2022)]NJI72500.1 glycerophosphodiester phosphodiesterase family protein [Sphingobacterium sp. B16(2022)]
MIHVLTAVRVLLLGSSILFSVAYGQSERLLTKLAHKEQHIAAHRGAHKQCPENSIASIVEAIELGVSVVEIDIRSTKDGVLILMHDGTVDRTTTGKGKVSNLSYAEIQDMYLRDTPAGAASNDRVPTLKEVLRLCKGKIILDIDFKEEDEKYVAKTFELIAAENMEDEVLFFLYDHRLIEKFYRLNPRITLFPRARSMKDLHEILKSKRTSIVHIDESFDNYNELVKLKDQGVILWMNSLGDTDEQALREGSAVYDMFLKKHPYVRIIQTDNPSLWKNMLSGMHRQ